MFSREQKMEKRKDFIASDLFGTATWTMLILFNQNIQAMIRLVEVEGIWIKELQNGTSQSNYSMTEQQKWETIHIAYLDSIAKLMMCIEGLIVLMYAVMKRRYGTLPRYMLRYQKSQIDSILDLMQSDDKARKALWRILGLPNLKYLELDRSDRKVAWNVLNHTVEAGCKAFSEIRDFYLDHLTVYWKFKHGLSIMLGLPSSGQPPVESLLYAFDRSGRVPPGYKIEMGEKLQSSSGLT